MEAQLHFVKGNLVLQSKVQSLGSEVSQSQILNPKAQAEAEVCFLKAIEIARQQQARSLELRATVSLARLWQQQGKLHAARKMLSAIYHWFTEGFETADLQEAKVLLDELTYTSELNVP